MVGELGFYVVVFFGLFWLFISVSGVILEVLEHLPKRHSGHRK
jgi:hypothetical protein